MEHMKRTEYMKRIIGAALALAIIVNMVLVFSPANHTTAYALDTSTGSFNGTGGMSSAGTGSADNYWSTNNLWYGLRITVVENPDVWHAQIVPGTKTIEIANLSAVQSTFFDRTTDGENVQQGAEYKKVLYFAKSADKSKMGKLQYCMSGDDGIAWESYVDNDYFSTLLAPPPGLNGGVLPMLGATPPNWTVEKFGEEYVKTTEFLNFVADNVDGAIGNDPATGGIITNTNESLKSGKYRILLETVVYMIWRGQKVALTAYEAAALSQELGLSLGSILGGYLPSSQYLDHDDELTGFLAWTGGPDFSTGHYVGQPGAATLDDLATQLGFSIWLDDYDPPPTPTPTVTPTPPVVTPPTVIDDGGLRIIKLEAGTTNALNGAVFRVTQTTHWEQHLIDPDGNDLGEYYDDDNGGSLDSGDAGYHHNIEDLGDDVLVWLEVRDVRFIGTYATTNGVVDLTLEPGNYIVEEITPPYGYLLDENPIQTIDIPREGGGEHKLTFENVKRPTLEIIKLSAGTLKPLGGAEFLIEGISVSYQATLPTVSGSIYLDNLEPGTYRVTEITPPDGYVLSEPQSQEIYLAPGQNGVLTFENPTKPTLEIIKVENGTGLPLGYADFEITGIDVPYQHTAQTSLSTGTLTLPNLMPGTYSVREVSAPAGYVLDTSVQIIELRPGETGRLTFTNTRKPGIIIYKIDADTGDRLPGAEYRVALNGGAEFWDVRTDANGSVYLETMEPGTYIVTELTAPEHYLNDTEPQTVILTAGESYSLTFANHKKPSLIIEKYDEQTSTLLDGATFSVAHKGGIEVWSGIVTGGRIRLDDLDDGWYTVTELAAPDGYLISTTSKDVYLSGGKVTTVVFTNRKKPVLVIVKLDEETKQPLAGAKFKVQKTESNTVAEYVTGEDGTIIIPNLDEAIYSIEEIIAPGGYVLNPQHKDILLEWGKTSTVVFTNLKKPTLTVIKYDELTNEPLPGASFRLWKTEGETWSETLITDDDGHIIWTDLDPGIYSVQEIDEPYGYFKDTNRKEILLEGGDNKQLEFFNRPRPTLTILKRDAVTGLPIANVKFKVQKTEGETIGEFLTDSDGMIELSPATGYLLDEAVYVVTEITPPNEYLLDANPSKQILLKWYEPTELVFENFLKPTLIFTKTNGLTGRGISDATYRVDYESASGGVTSLGEYKTKCGLIVLPYVMPGWYILTETKPAPGYSLPTQPTQRMYLAPGENSYTYDQTHEDLYADPRTDPANGTRGSCGDWCGYLCSHLCGMTCGTPVGFAGLVITNGKGEPLGTTSAPATDTVAPILTAGAVTRTSDTNATVQFKSNEAGKYYYAYVTSGALAPIIVTSGTGTTCTTSMTTVTLTISVGAKDFYVKVKDASGNVSTALKIEIPGYLPPMYPEPPPLPSNNGGIIYHNPDFPGIIIKIGGK